MCGILGIIAPCGAAVDLDRTTLIAMRDRMKSRGPDDAGLFIKQNVAMAHRRLAIRDLQAGRQPWLSDDEQTVLVYNGELYNDGELRTVLRTAGHQFRTRCDTEVVMAAYRQWGADCIRRFRGMFALGIYDFRDRSLLLARDRFGVKPLFLTQVGDDWLFASAIAALLRHPRLSRAPDWATVSHYLTTFRTTLGRRTLYQGIWQLLPGEYLEWRDGQVRIASYATLPTEVDNSTDFEEAVDEFQHRLAEAVARRLVSDVPVGMFLSGGVDSNTLACLMRETSGIGHVGYCGGGADGPEDDFHAAAHCARHVGFEYGDVRLSHRTYHEYWLEMVRQLAVPLSTPSDVILYALARSMKPRVGVVLGGEGADELLCGYAVSHWSGHDYERSCALARGTWPGTSVSARLFRASLQRQYGRDRFLSEVDHYLSINGLVPIAAKPMLYQPHVWRDLEQDRPIIEFYAAELANWPDLPTSRKYTLLLHRINLEGLLSRLDAATMLAGLEARVPYTDAPLVEWVLRLPESYRIGVSEHEQAPWLASAELQRRGSLESKRLLRRLARRLMPRTLAERPKASFPTPVQRWLKDPWARWARHSLKSSRFARELFRLEAIDELADDVPTLGMWLWPMLNLLLWGEREFCGSDRLEQAA